MISRNIAVAYIAHFILFKDAPSHAKYSMLNQTQQYDYCDIARSVTLFSCRVETELIISSKKDVY